MFKIFFDCNNMYCISYNWYLYIIYFIRYDSTITRIKLYKNFNLVGFSVRLYTYIPYGCKGGCNYIMDNSSVTRKRKNSEINSLSMRINWLSVPITLQQLAGLNTHCCACVAVSYVRMCASMYKRRGYLVYKETTQSVPQSHTHNNHYIEMCLSVQCDSITF